MILRSLLFAFVCHSFAFGAPIQPGPGDEWKNAANERIESIRKGDFDLRLTHPDGTPLPLTEVTVELQQHHFLFGTAIAGKPWKERKPGEKGYYSEKKYRNYVLDHFSSVVSENDMKWAYIEKERGKVSYWKADKFVDWAHENGIRVRGHCLFWSRPKHILDWVKELSDEELEAHVFSHLRETVGHFKGRVVCWDVNNELLDGRFYRDRLGDDVLVRMFQEAHAIDPDADLFVNEFSILGSDEKTERYAELVQQLLDSGAPVGGIGVQEHEGELFRSLPTGDNIEIERQSRSLLVPEEVLARLDRLGEFGLPIHLTEISFRSAEPELRVKAVDDLYRLAFSHPAVEAVSLWGFWQGRHWLRDAGLIDSKWNALPAWDHFSYLVNEEWTTRLETTTDADGGIRFRGFYGKYLVTTPAGDQFELVLAPGQEPAVVALAKHVDPAVEPPSL